MRNKDATRHTQSASLRPNTRFSSMSSHLLDQADLEEGSRDGNGGESATSPLDVGSAGGNDGGLGGAGLGWEAGGAIRGLGRVNGGLGGRRRRRRRRSGRDGGRQGLGLVAGGGRVGVGGLGDLRGRRVRLLGRGGLDGADGGADGHDDGGDAGAGGRASGLLRGAADDGLDGGRVDGAGGPLAGVVAEGLGDLRFAGDEVAGRTRGAGGARGAGLGEVGLEATDFGLVERDLVLGRGEGSQGGDGEKSELHGEYYASRVLVVGIFEI